MTTPNVTGGSVSASNAVSATTASGGPAAQNSGPSPGPPANNGSGGVDRDQIYQWILGFETNWK